MDMVLVWALQPPTGFWCGQINISGSKWPKCVSPVMCPENGEPIGWKSWLILTHSYNYQIWMILCTYVASPIIDMHNKFQDDCSSSFWITEVCISHYFQTQHFRKSRENVATSNFRTPPGGQSGQYIEKIVSARNARKPETQKLVVHIYWIYGSYQIYLICYDYKLSVYISLLVSIWCRLTN